MTKKLSNKDKENINSYNKKIIHIDDDMESVRENLGMYIQSRSNKGFLNMIREVFQNSLDEMMKPTSPCDHVSVFYDERYHHVRIEDNGRGIPFNLLEDVYLKLNTSSNYNKELFEYSSGKHGVGAKVTNAFSSSFIVESYILGEGRRIEFKDGKKIGEIQKIKNVNKQGTMVEFTPNETDDYKHIGPIDLNYKHIYNLLNGIMPLTHIGNLVVFQAITLDGQNIERKLVNEDGIMQDIINRCNSPLIKPIVLSADTGELKADIAFTYDVSNMSGEESIRNFSNFCPMRTGTHLEGFMDGVCKFFTHYMNKIYLNSTRKTKKSLTIKNQDIKTGLLGIVAVSALHPIFGGQSKDTLENVEMKVFVKDLVLKGLDEWSKSNPRDIQKVCQYLKKVGEARTKLESEKVKIAVKYDTSIFSGSLPSNFIKPSGTDHLELIIVEGESAKGSTRNSRDKSCQGIFPIRGKMPNPVDTTKAHYLANAEVRAIMAICKKYNWEKIIIASDADVDGYHIRTLVFKLFLFYMPKYIEEGKLYSAIPPLYGLLNNKNEVVKYFRDKLEYSEFLTESYGKQNKIEDSTGYKYNEKDIVSLLYNNNEYTTDVKILSDTYAINPLLLEYTIHLYSILKRNKDFFKNFKKCIKKKFRFMDVTVSNNILILDGVINSQSNTLILNDQFFNDKGIRLLINKISNNEINYKLNDKPCSLYELLFEYEETSKKLGKIRRYKGLGEMKPEELSESTLDPDPDGDRVLIQFNMDDSKELISKIRNVESDRKKLLQNTTYKLSKEDLIG